VSIAIDALVERETERLREDVRYWEKYATEWEERYNAALDEARSLERELESLSSKYDDSFYLAKDLERALMLWDNNLYFGTGDRLPEARELVEGVLHELVALRA
jgi:hypothetical protein